MDLLLVEGLSVMIATVLGAAGAIKLWHLREFQLTVASWGLPSSWSQQFSIMFPVAEVAVGVSIVAALVAERWQLATLTAATLLFAALAGGQSWILLRHVRREKPRCGCFRGASTIGGRTLLRGVCLLAMAAFAVWIQWSSGGSALVGSLG